METMILNNVTLWRPYRKAKCACPDCEREAVWMIPTRKRGGTGEVGVGGIGVCEYHLNDNESYFADNTNWIGHPMEHGLTFSVEDELSKCDQYARLQLMSNMELPTNDATVEVEFKTARCYSLCSMSKSRQTIEDMIQSGHIEADYTCGTHFHIGAIHNSKHISMEEAMPVIRRFYHSFFVNLCNEIASDETKCTRIFGRYFGTWSSLINLASNPMEHTNFINCQHNETIEFRLNKMITANQYMEACKLEVKFVQIVLEACEKINRLDASFASAEEKRAEARKACEKMTKLYKAM